MTLSTWFPRSNVGLVFAAIYIVVAIYAVYDARTSQGGGWISLKGIGVTLVTFPVAFLGEVLGFKPDYRRNLDMTFSIGACTVLVYFAGLVMARGARAILAGGNNG